MMVHLIEPQDLTLEQIEQIERASCRLVFQSLKDFGAEACRIFFNSPDDQTEVAEDVTREALGRLPGYPIPSRIYGVMDFKRAGYVFLPDLAVRQALLIDSKAEKAANVARLQTSQTSLPIRQIRAGQVVEVPGGLPADMSLDGHSLLTTTIFIHYHYHDVRHGRQLKRVTIAALPNGRLAQHYVPTAQDTIWVAGPNAPSRGEMLRTRLSFSKLKAKMNWRVQRLQGEDAVDGGAPGLAGQWQD